MNADYSQYQNVTKSDGNVSTTLQCIQASIGQICNSNNNKIVEELKIEASIINPGIGRVKILDNKNKRFEVEDIGISNKQSHSKMFMIESLGFEYQTNPQFGFRFRRNETGQIMFEQFNNSLIYMEQYMEIGFQIPS